ncbi:MAG: T9SS C-terminal target domain-containing protein [Flavobacteriia bacterium]|nr:MAG: T9SS C-terminal target domain-containing protein [Flavobacteriia bacterium]
MKKGLFLVAALTSASLYAQQYVHQVLIANEGYFDFQTNDIVEPATIGSYNPATQTYVVVDTLDGQRFSSDIIIDGNFYFVAADTKIFKYNLNTHQEVGSISLPGVRNLAIAGDKLIATRGEYLQTFDSYLQVFDKNTLQLIAALDTNNGPQWAAQNIVVVNNIAYIAVNNAYEWGNEKGLVGQLDLNTLQYGSEIDLGTEGKNPDNMFLYNNELYTVNNKDWSGASVSKISLNGAVNTQNLANAVTGCGTSALRDDKLVYQISMENTLNDYSLLNMALVGPVAGITNNFYDLAQEPISGNLYASVTDFFSTGSVSIFDNANNLVDQFAAGVSPGTIVFDVRSSVGFTEINQTFGVYPNPSNGVFQIAGLTAGDTYQITNATGQVIFEGQSNTIDLRSFDAGVYLIQTQNGQARLLKY